MNNQLLTCSALILLAIGCPESTTPGEDVEVRFDAPAPTDTADARDTPRDPAFIPWEPNPDWVTCGRDGEVLGPRNSIPPDCEHVLSNLVYPHHDFGRDPFLSELSNLRAIQGKLTFNANPGLANLEGLERLEYIGDNLQITNANSLTTLEHLSGLRRVDGGIGLGHLPNLVDLRGLENLESTGGLFLTALLGLNSISSLINLRRVRGDVGVRHCPLLNREEVEAFFSTVDIDGELIIELEVPR